jgi:hypothetical protein
MKASEPGGMREIDESRQEEAGRVELVGRFVLFGDELDRGARRRRRGFRVIPG